MASPTSCPEYRTGAKPCRAPLAVIPPARSTATTLSPYSGVAYSDTSWPCWAKSNADATPPLPAPSTATRIPTSRSEVATTLDARLVVSARAALGGALGGFGLRALDLLLFDLALGVGVGLLDEQLSAG